MAQDRNAALRIVFGADTGQLDKALGSLSRRLTKVGKSLSKTGATMSRSITAPLAGIAAISIKTATDFEFSLAKVQAVSGFSANAMEALGESAKQFGAQTAFSASQVAGLQKELAKLGFESQEIISLTPGVLALAQAFDLELGDAAEKVALNLNRFNLEASDAGRVADVMATAFGSSALDAENLNEALKMVAPVANQAGFTIEQVSGILGVLANQGVAGSMAGTGLTKVFTTLAKEGKDVKDGFSEILTGSATTAEAFERFGDRAGKIIPILQNNSDEVANLTKKLFENEGAAQAARLAMEDTTRGALKRMSSGLEAAGIAIGEAMLPLFQSLVDVVIRIAGAFNSLAPAQQKIIIAMAAFAAAIGPVLMVSGSMVTAFGALSGAAATLGISMTAALGPIGVIVGVVGIGLAMAFNKAGNEAEELRIKQEALNVALQDVPDRAKDATSKVLQLEGAMTDMQASMDGVLPGGQSPFAAIIDPDILKDIKDYELAMLKVRNATIKTRKAELVEGGMSMRGADIQATAEATKAYQQSLMDYLETLRETNQAEADSQTSAAKGAEQLAALRKGVTDANQSLNDYKDTQNNLKQAGEGLADSQETYLRTLRGKWKDYARAQVAAGEDSTLAQKEIAKVTQELRALDKGFISTNQTIKGFAVDDIGKAMNRLSESLLDAQAAFSVTDDNTALLNAQAKAYENAAIAAAKFGDINLSQDLAEQAKALENSARQARDADIAQTTLLDTMFKLGFAATEVADTKIGSLLTALEDVGEKSNETSTRITQTTDTFANFAESVTQAALGFFDSFARNLSTAVEDAVAAGESMKSIGSIAGNAFAGVLDALGGILLQVGKQAIATGAAIKAIKEALKTLNPAVAIAAGVALIALAGAIKGNLAKSAEGIGGVPKLARGGIAVGEQLAIIGDNPSGKEAIIPFERMGEFMSMAQGNSHTSVTGRLQGMDLLLSNQRAELARNRNT